MSLEDNRGMNIDLYTDPRSKLGNAPDTIITCKNFLDAVEKNLYGFNWTCPNGGDGCTYRHMLPTGYVLNRDKAGQESESDDEMTLEEKIEEERAALPSDGLTPVTLETFNKWKEDRAARKKAELEAKIAAEEAKGKKDKAQMAFMSGRALFQFNPDLFEDAEDAGDDIVFEEDEIAAEEAKAAAEESKEEESKSAAAAVHVDSDLFAEDAAAADEEVDFD